MRTIEFIAEKLKDIGAFVEMKQERVLVLYNDMIIAEISRDDDSLADIYVANIMKLSFQTKKKEESS